ncbi:hypothetical protein [Treponema phagedenis]|uniref:Uncharacterized protein n=1 Tax=Treponema phagedenis TaxID=162 RepID=A0AAE6ITC5_TREPH|nr:hypothetical protein [Treponema phagedenis]EFW39335.1 hypothetical protein HMPREF9554_00143 [Treponema phagedenis F0421]QEJ94816.1 hypothetical protein FUT79_06065 [Treponema phagedenis]QEJ98002.1 hypothetical protein FUT82_08325 [Treponema phagedenis]QEK00721.1 hypothetical protein FUT84_05755 [Treponema phagedenis]QEK03509.1 hypothetical protein FUT83_06620 [Treponema phagedenis]
MEFSNGGQFTTGILNSQSIIVECLDQHNSKLITKRSINLSCDYFSKISLIRIIEHKKIPSGVCRPTGLK